jgi:hypothetical protein
MPRWIALLVAGGCAHGPPPKAPRDRQEVVPDVDLTAGNAGPGAVTGGRWEGGWRVTSRHGERIVFDAGRPLPAGYLEVRYTMSKPPHAAPVAKINRLRYLVLGSDRYTGVSLDGIRFLHVKLVAYPSPGAGS